MTSTIYSQLFSVLCDKTINPFDLPAVQNKAYRLGYYELIRFLEKHRDWYIEHLINNVKNESKVCGTCEHCPF